MLLRPPQLWLSLGTFECEKSRSGEVGQRYADLAKRASWLDLQDVLLEARLGVHALSTSQWCSLLEHKDCGTCLVVLHGERAWTLVKRRG